MFCVHLTGVFIFMDLNKYVCTDLNHPVCDVNMYNDTVMTMYNYYYI